MQTFSSPIYRISAILILFLAIFTGCKKDPGTPPVNTSEGTLVLDNGYCTSAAVHGRLFVGVISDSSYLELSVNVTKTGPYHIITDNQDGVVFSADSVFTTTGLQKVRLKAKGLFPNYGTINFLAAYNSSPCQLSVNVYDSAYRDQPDNTWQFTVNGHVYKGTGFAIEYHLPTYSGDHYDFFGSLDGRTDTSFKIGSLIYNFEHPDDYNHHSSQSGSFFSFATPAGYTPAAAFSAYSNNPAVDINVYTSGPFSVVYKFDGTAIDSAGNIYPITRARYRADHGGYVDLE